MATIADNLKTLEQSKQDIKNAIINKGVTPEGGLVTYSAAIDKIPYNETGIALDWEGTGYDEYEITELVDDLQNAINIAKQIPLVWEDEFTLKGRTDLLFVPHFEFKNPRYWNRASLFEMCTNLLTVPNIELGTDNTYISGLSTASRVFKDCHNLRMLPDGFNLGTKYISYPDICNYTFSGCWALQNLPQLSSFSTNNYNYAFDECYNLTNVKGFRGYKGSVYFSDSPLTLESINNIVGEFAQPMDRYWVTLGLSRYSMDLKWPGKNEVSDKDLKITYTVTRDN